MRVFLISLYILCAASMFAQTDTSGFWSLMPDTVHQQRFLKNWKLNGPIKQIVFKKYPFIRLMNEPENSSDETWDALNVSALDTLEAIYKDTSRWSPGPTYDTIKFSTSRLLELVFRTKDDGYVYYFANKGEEEWAYLHLRYKVVTNKAGLPKYWLGQEEDTIEYVYDQKNRLTAKHNYDKYFIGQSEYWQYPNDTTSVYLIQFRGVRMLTMIERCTYNSKGLLIGKVQYKGGPPFDEVETVGTETVYTYDRAGNLISSKSYSPMSYYIYSEEKNYTRERTSVNGIDSVITLYSYNNDGQLIRKELMDYSVNSGEYYDLKDTIKVSKIQEKRITDYTYEKHGLLAKKNEYVVYEDRAKEYGVVQEYRYSFDKNNNPTKILLIESEEGYSEVERRLKFIQFIHYEYYE